MEANSILQKSIRQASLDQLREATVEQVHQMPGNPFCDVGNRRHRIKERSRARANQGRDERPATPPPSMFDAFRSAQRERSPDTPNGNARGGLPLPPPPPLDWPMDKVYHPMENNHSREKYRSIRNRVKRIKERKKSRVDHHRRDERSESPPPPSMWDAFRSAQRERSPDGPNGNSRERMPLPPPPKDDYRPEPEPKSTLSLLQDSIRQRSLDLLKETSEEHRDRRNSFPPHGPPHDDYRQHNDYHRKDHRRERSESPPRRRERSESPPPSMWDAFRSAQRERSPDVPNGNVRGGLPLPPPPKDDYPPESEPKSTLSLLQDSIRQRSLDLLRETSEEHRDRRNSFPPDEPITRGKHDDEFSACNSLMSKKIRIREWAQARNAKDQAPRPTGRGRGATLPAWMTEKNRQESGPGRKEPEGEVLRPQGRGRSATLPAWMTQKQRQDGPVATENDNERSSSHDNTVPKEPENENMKDPWNKWSKESSSSRRPDDWNYDRQDRRRSPSGLGQKEPEKILRPQGRGRGATLPAWMTQKQRQDGPVGIENDKETSSSLDNTVRKEHDKNGNMKDRWNKWKRSRSKELSSSRRQRSPSEDSWSRERKRRKGSKRSRSPPRLRHRRSISRSPSRRSASVRDRKDHRHRHRRKRSRSRDKRSASVSSRQDRGRRHRRSRSRSHGRRSRSRSRGRRSPRDHRRRHGRSRSRSRTRGSASLSDRRHQRNRSRSRDSRREQRHSRDRDELNRRSRSPSPTLEEAEALLKSLDKAKSLLTKLKAKKLGSKLDEAKMRLAKLKAEKGETGEKAETPEKAETGEWAETPEKAETGEWAETPEKAEEEPHTND